MNPAARWLRAHPCVEAALIAMMRFARVPRRDIDAVDNAIELPWSNGQAEGRISRLKAPKRAMYGRAGPKCSEHECCNRSTQSEQDLI